MRNIERDAEILRQHNIMDYSLLFGIEKNPHYVKLKGGAISKTTTSVISVDNDQSIELTRNFEKTRHTFLSKGGKFIYHLAIIDYL